MNLARRLDREQLWNDLKIGIILLLPTAVSYHLLGNVAGFTCYRACNPIQVAVIQMFRIVASLGIAVFILGLAIILLLLAATLIERYTVEQGGGSQ